jgi:hypothetical protein
VIVKFSDGAKEASATGINDCPDSVVEKHPRRSRKKTSCIDRAGAMRRVRAVNSSDSRFNAADKPADAADIPR